MQDLLRGQQQYYNERAAEYDEWWLRQGRYDHGADENAVWFAEQAQVRAAFAAPEMDWSGDVLELASGTGIWTAWLAERARSVTVLDGSAEMIALNRNRIAALPRGAAERVRYEQVDLFEWHPQQQCDALMLCYFISHIPEALLDAFIGRLAEALRPGGALAILDGRRDPHSSSPDQPLAPEMNEVMTRRLNDGRAFTIVKRFDDPQHLTHLLERHGFRATVRTTARHFLYATAVRT